MERAFGALPPPGWECVYKEGRTLEELEAIFAEIKDTGKTPAEVIEEDKWRERLKQF